MERKRAKKFAWFGMIAAAIALSGCASKKNENSAAAPSSYPAPSPPAGGTASYDSNSAPAIAQREAIRRQERIRQMDDAALRASQRMADDDLEGAVEGYRRAIGGLGTP